MTDIFWPKRSRRRSTGSVSAKSTAGPERVNGIAGRNGGFMLHTESSLAQRITEIVTENLGDDISNASGKSDLINDLHADSLDVLNIMLAVEQEFGITVADEEVATCRTIEAIVALLATKLKPHAVPNDTALPAGVEL